MFKFTVVIVALSFCILPAMLTLAESAAETQYTDNLDVTKLVPGITIALKGSDISDKTFELRYEIRNGSHKDVWICDEPDIDNPCHFEIYLAEDRQTLVLRRRLDVPMVGIFREQPRGRYIRLRAGQSRTESLLLSLPIRPNPVFTGIRQKRGTVYVKRLTLDIGYYDEDLPAMVLNLLEGAEDTSNEDRDPNMALAGRWLGSMSHFNATNEYFNFGNRDEQVVVGWSDQTFEGEHFLQLTLGGLRIPYSSELLYFTTPDIDPGTRLEIKYEPSMLEYFYSHVEQMNLLSPVEKHELGLTRTAVVDDPKCISAFIRDVSEGFHSSGIVRQKGVAHVVCYRDDERLNCLTIYNDASVATEGNQRFLMCVDGFPSLRMCIPRIQPFELRVQCASNMKNLWHRLNLYRRINKASPEESSSRSNAIYPPPADWCDTMMRVYEGAGLSDKGLMRPHLCPSVGEGKNHYGINPDCKANSAPDMVLLFEAKAGWNQHGGPELLTFDNHDPKGGCVLLNDGTVKFVRTDEELRQLRWE